MNQYASVVSGFSSDTMISIQLSKTYLQPNEQNGTAAYVVLLTDEEFSNVNGPTRPGNL